MAAANSGPRRGRPEVDFGCGGGQFGSISSDIASSREVPIVDEEFAELLRRERALAPSGKDIL
jgi:hypothetical protein